MAGIDVAVGVEAETEASPAVGVRYLNRELSFLDFVARVLALAEDPTVPLLERAKFLAIVSEHLDEFFQVRVAGIMEQLAAGLRTTIPDGLDLVDLLREIRARVTDLCEREVNVFSKELVPALDERGVGFAQWDDLSADDRAYLDDLFTENIFPVLTPLAVDPAHPFPYISNLSLNLAVTVRDSATGEERFARVKVPPLLPRFLELPDAQRFVLLEQLIAAKLDALFPGMEVLAHSPFRVTRDTDFELEDEAEDLLEAVESVLRRRSRFGRVVRLEVDTHMSDETLALLCRELELSEADVTTIDGPLDLVALWALYALDRPDLKDELWVPQTQAALCGRRRAARLLPPARKRPTCSCTTPTTRSPRRSSSSSSRRRATLRSSRSSRRSTAPPAPRARSSASLDQGRRSRACRWSPSSSSRRGSTSRRTSNVPACSKRRACTWCTGWSG